MLRLYGVTVVILLLFAIEALAGYKDDKGPIGVRWTVRNLKSIVSWYPLKRWRRRHVVYQLQSCLSNCRDDSSWVDRSCKAVKAYPKGMECEVDVPLICGTFRLRAKVSRQMRPPAGEPTCNNWRCTEYVETHRACLLDESINSKPEIAINSNETSAVNISIKLPHDNVFFCHFSSGVQYTAYLMELAAWNGTNACKSLPPIKEISNVISKFKTTVRPSQEVLCSEQRGDRTWTVNDLKPGTEYCLFGSYSFGHYIDDFRSEIAYHSFTTVKRAKVLPAKRRPRSGQSRRLLAAFVSVTLAVMFALLAYKIRKKWKKLSDYVYGELPEPLKEISDDMDKVARDRNADIRRPLSSISVDPRSANATEHPEKLFIWTTPDIDEGKSCSIIHARHVGILSYGESSDEDYLVPETISTADNLSLIDCPAVTSDARTSYGIEDDKKNEVYPEHGGYMSKLHFLAAPLQEAPDRFPAFANMTYFKR